MQEISLKSNKISTVAMKVKAVQNSSYCFIIGTVNRIRVDQC